jgi:hypothetical protein
MSLNGRRGRASEETRPVAGGKTDKAITAKKSLPAKVRPVKDKLNGSIALSGALHVTGPGILDRLRAGEEIMLKKHDGEFGLKVSEGGRLDFAAQALLIDASEADVIIKAGAMDEPIEFTFNFELRDGAGTAFEVLLSLAQADRLLKLLSAYVKAWEAAEVLRVEYQANSVPSRQFINAYRNRLT